MQRSILFEPFSIINTCTIKNRFFKVAMSETLATKDNRPSDMLVNLYHRRAQGGTGVFMSGNVMIDRTQLGEPNNIVEDERHIAMLENGLKRELKTIHT